MPTYLDDNGNEIDESAIYLDDEGQPTQRRRRQPRVSQTSDVIQSALTGLQHAPGLILGQFRDLSDLGDEAAVWGAEQAARLTGQDFNEGRTRAAVRGVNAARDAVTSTMFGPAGMAVTGLRNGPSSRDFNEAIDQAIPGEQHEPQTTAGEYARTIAEFAPAAAFPGGAAMRTARVVAPAVLSETGGQIGREISPEAEMAGRLIGGVGGGIGTEYAAQASRLLPRLGMTPDERAVRIIDRGMRDANMTPAELQRRARTLRRQGGQTAETVAEVGGEPLQRQARAVANVRGPGQQIAADTLEARTGSITPRVLGEATRATRPQQTRAPRNFYDARESLRQARAGQASDAYRIAHSRTVDQAVVRDQLMPLIRRGPNAALTSAVNQLDSAALNAQSELVLAQRANDAQAVNRWTTELANIEESISQLRTIGQGQMPNAVNVRALDYYQRGLGQMAENAGYRSPEGRALEGARDTFNRVADQLAPEFGQARSNYGQSIRIEELMSEGRRVFNIPEGELDIILRGRTGAGLTMEELDGFMLGALDAIETKVRAGDTAFVARFMRNENWQRQLTRALGEQGARRLRNRIAREARMRGFDNAVRRGSQTTPMAEDIKALTRGEDELGFLSEIIQSGGNVRGPVLRAAAGVYDRMRKPGIYNPQVNEALARRLYGRATPANINALEAELNALQARQTMRLGQAPDPSILAADAYLGARTTPEDKKRRRLGE